MDCLILSIIKYRGQKWTAIKMEECYSIFLNKIQKDSSRGNIPDISIDTPIWGESHQDKIWILAKLPI
jgi:hypothetical protein